MPWKIRTATWQTDKALLGQVRETVFIEEQSVPVALEWDEWDEKAWHLLAIDQHGKPLGTARMLPTGQIGRMAVLKEYRHQGIGSELLKQAIDLAKAQQLAEIFLHAQTAVKPFYTRLGFISRGEEFLDAGIPHIEMYLTADFEDQSN